MYQRSRWSLRRRSARRLQCLTWSGEEVRARASNAILHAAANDRVNVVASIIHRDDILRARPSLPTVIGFNHCVCADVGSAYAEVREEEIDYPVAVGTDCAELTAAVLGVGSCLSDLSGRPCIPTIAGDGNHHRPGRSVPSRTAAERRVGDVHIAKKRARGTVVGPDLILVRKERSVLPGNKDWPHPGVLITCRCSRYIISARHVNCSKASEGLAEITGEVGII